MNENYEKHLISTQAEMLMRPMVTERINNVVYDQRFMRPVEFQPTMVEDEDYYTELQRIDHVAILRENDDRFVEAFLMAKNYPESVFCQRHPVTKELLRKIKREKYDELLFKKQISAERAILRGSVAYSFYELENLPQLQKANNPIEQLIHTPKRNKNSPDRENMPEMPAKCRSPQITKRPNCCLQKE